MENTTAITPGKTICILGAGQLCKMSLVAAHQLGYHTIVWAPEGDIPAMEMATHRLVAPFDDRQAFDEVCRTASVVTTEWENIPAELLQLLEDRGVSVRPSSRVLSVAQSRKAEKDLARSLSIPIAPTAWLPKGLVVKDTNWNDYFPGILKTDRFGYDGKGQWPVSSVDNLEVAFAEADTDCVLERKVDLSMEISILVARRADGTVSVSNAVANVHQDGILRQTTWKPGLISKQMEREVWEIGVAVADELELEGVLALEFFIPSEERSPLFNEMAPRPHNSFHGSIEAAKISQFEQHIRSVCNLPLGFVTFHTPFEMYNLIGGSWEEDWQYRMENGLDHSTRFHFYGKNASRPGRKMGHLTRLLVG